MDLIPTIKKENCVGLITQRKVSFSCYFEEVSNVVKSLTDLKTERCVKKDVHESESSQRVVNICSLSCCEKIL